jgi:hypothetical protein
MTDEFNTEDLMDASKVAYQLFLAVSIELDKHNSYHAHDPDPSDVPVEAIIKGAICRLPPGLRERVTSNQRILALAE